MDTNSRNSKSKNLPATSDASGDMGDIGFIPAAMVYVAMPHSDQVGQGVFKRTNGLATFSIVTDPEIGLPYGKIPRIITAYLSSEAKKRGSKTIEIGESQSQFMRLLGMKNTGGANGTIARLHDQAKRLFSATIQIITDTEEYTQGKHLIISDSYKLWKPQGKDVKWRGEIELTDKFFTECVERAVPISMKTIMTLRSPLTIDLYIWMTYRYNGLSSPACIPWKALQQQLGSSYAMTGQGAYDFRKFIRQHMAEISEFYPAANYVLDENGVILKPSKTHIKML